MKRSDSPSTSNSQQIISSPILEINQRSISAPVVLTASDSGVACSSIPDTASNSRQRSRFSNLISRLFRRYSESGQRSSVGTPVRRMIPTPDSPAPECLEEPSPLVRANAYTPQTPTEHPEQIILSCVYIWGDNSNGQAMSNLDENQAIPYRIDRVSHRCITHLNCGTQATWLVSDAGDIYAGGLNNKGQISPSSDDSSIRSARHLEEFETMKVKSVALGDEHTVLVLDGGAVVSYGTNEFGQLGHGIGTESLGRVSPKRMLGLKVPVSQACCGSSHSLVLSYTGQVFSCGNSADGCLGLGSDHQQADSILQPIPSLIGVPVQQISSGPEHSMALSLSGHIFSWGRNRKGRLGLGPDAPPIVYTPTLIHRTQADETFKYIATGTTHSAAIAPGGCLYLCGDNSDCQLGIELGVIDHSDTFRKLEFPTKIRLVACGDRHTVIISNAGEVYGFGRNVEGQLGRRRGDPMCISYPIPINFYDEKTGTDLGKNLYFYTVAAGRDHTAVVGVPFPPGVARRNSVVVSESVTDPAVATTPSRSFQTSLSRLGSKTLVLHSGTPKAQLSSGACFSIDPALLLKSSSLQHLPSIVSKNPVRPSLHSFQATSFEKMLAAMGDPTQHMTKSRHMTMISIVGAPQSDDAETHLPSGCSVGEILSLIESIRSVKDSETQLRFLKRRLTSVFSDPHRLNCSFLLPGRLTLLDVEGVEEIFDEIDKMNTTDKDSLYQALGDAASELLSMVEPHAALFMHADQVRCLALILQLRFLNNPKALNLRLLGRLSSLVFKMPEAGRRCLVDLFKTQYPSNTFGQRIVGHLREFLNTSIRLNGSSPDVVWHGIILFQLMYLSSTEWAVEQRRRAIEIAGRALIVGKIPLEDFVLESINDYSQIAEELCSFQKYGPSVESDRLTVGPRSNPICFARTPFPTGSGLRFQISTFSDNPVIISSSSSSSSAQQSEPTMSDMSIPVEFAGPMRETYFKKLKEKEKVAEKGITASQSITTTITGRPPGIFDPPEALTVKERSDKWTFFLAHQNICPLKFKRNVIMVEASVNQHKSSMESMFMQRHPFFFMPVRRNNIVEDALNIVLCTPSTEMLKPLKLIFDGEEGVDAGGLKREFFDIIVKTLFDPQFGMFIYVPDARTVWFSRNTIDTNDEFFLVGVVLGLALYNDNLLYLQFPNVVWKKLQDIPTTIDDLADLFPTEGESLMKVQEWPADKIDEFHEAFGTMSFEVQYDFFGETRTIELKPGGKEILLTYENRREYVDCYVDYLLNSSVCQQFEAFKIGFLHFQTSLLKTLSAEELHLLVCGTMHYDFDELKEGTMYEGFDKDDPYIEGFWEILNDLDMHQKKKFLRFCTGTDRVPLGGLKELELKLQRNGSEPIDRLPTAYTCFNLLLLPEYSSKIKLKRLLILAIEQFQGFGLQ